MVTDSDEKAEPIDLGVIVARPVGSSERETSAGPSPDWPPPDGHSDVPAPPRSSVVSGVRLSAAEMFSEIRDAHRGPKANTRPVPRWVRRLAWFLDESIPVGGDRRVGLDGVVSFVPGIGDAAGLVASMVVVLAGVGSGVSLPTLTLMMVHVGIDAIVGAVPFLGAIFDLGYKANTRNLRLIERDLADRAGARRSAIKVFVLSFVAIVAGWILFLIALIGGTYLFARLVVALF